MSGFAKIKRGCCFVRFQPCQDSESRGDRYEEKILADIIPFRRFGGTFIVTVHVSPRLDNGDLMFSKNVLMTRPYSYHQKKTTKISECFCDPIGCILFDFRILS